ncbi:uncharacterized protein LOC134216657 [Armigeres subalbatus]|uniref:uncharacterized protein LOC134216657 n=1 Tax=Armigeres subalbatus TaxID=124917 RepID=UPI002ED34457
MHRTGNSLAIVVTAAAVAIRCCSVSVYAAALEEHQEAVKNTLPDQTTNDGRQPDLTTLQRIRGCMDRLDGSIESSQIIIETLLQQLNLGDPRWWNVKDGDATTVQLVRIQTADDRGLLIWTSNGFYISLSFILFLHLIILIIFGIITLCVSKPSASALPKVNV